MSESISNSSNFQIEDAARHLLETIKPCLVACTYDTNAPIDNHTRSPCCPCATLVLSTIGSDILKGYINLNGPVITKADVQVAMPHHNRQVSLQLPAGKFLEIQEISHVATLLTLLVQRIEIMRSSTKRFRKDLLEEAIYYCQNAILLLENSDFCETPSVPPAIVDDDGVAIAFTIQHASVVAVISPLVEFRASASTHGLVSQARSDMISRDIYVGRATSKQSQQRFEQYIRVEAAVPALLSTHKSLIECKSILTILMDYLNLK